MRTTTKCVMRRQSPVLALDVLDLIARFIATSTDMFKFIQAIPPKYLSQALSALGLLLRTKTLNDIEYYSEWCCAIQINRKLWPKFPLKAARMHRGDALSYRCDLLNQMFPLYSHVHNEPWSYGEAYSLHCIPWGGSYSKIYCAIDCGYVSYLLLDSHTTYSWHRNELPQQWKDGILFPKLETLVIDCVPEVLVRVVKLLRSPTGLKELDLSRFWITTSQLTSEFVEDLAEVATKLTTLKLCIEEITPLFASTFVDVPAELINEKNLMLMFRHAKLSGIRIETTDIAKVAQSATGKDFADFEIICSGSSGGCSAQTLKLLQTLQQMSSLRVLRIERLKLDANSCAQLASILPRLHKCYLDNNEIDDNGGVVLSRALLKCTRLEHLSITRQRIANEAAIAFANAINYGLTLRSLDFSSNQIGNDGVIALSSVLNRLELLKIAGNPFELDGALAVRNTICTIAECNFLKESHFPDYIGQSNYNAQKLSLPKTDKIDLSKCTPKSIPPSMLYRPPSPKYALLPYRVTSPAYVPASPAYTPHLPHFDATQQTFAPRSPAYNQGFFSDDE